MAIKPSGSLSLSEINTEFGAGTNLNAYRNRSWYTDSTSGTFSAGAISINDFYSKRAYDPYQLVTSPQAGRWAWGYNGYPAGQYGANQVTRGYTYISRQIYGATTLLDGYGNPYAGNGLYYPGNSVSNSYDTISWTNPSGYSVDVELQIYVGRSTDDYTRNLVFRGGSIANIYTHSGGTVVLDTGWTTGSYFTVVETVPANTTYTWYNYSGVMNGSGGDGNTSWINMRMLGLPGQRVTSAQVNRWAWGYNGYTAGQYGANQTVRGACYVSRQIYGPTTLLNAYGQPYAGDGLYYPGNSVANSYDTVSWTNSNSYPINVEIEVNVGRATDDATQNLVYRGGSIASISSHSGGTLILNTGATTGTLFRVVDTIPANTTYTYYNYSGVVSGSSADGCTSWLKLRVV
jgi:hypothetical protein